MSQLQTLHSDTRSGTTHPVPASPAAQDVGLLMLRLVLGVTIAAHGTQKLFGWFDGGGLDGTAQFFAASGYPAARTMAFVAGFIETTGGLAIAVGFLTPLAAAAVAGDMINAVGVKWNGGFFAPTGVEYELLIVVAALAVAVAGPGRIAVDRALPVLRAHRLAYGASAALVALVTSGVFLLLRS
ncbi:DoxX family protein [Streptomyces sp. NPDC088387]|uniref:DoxX family protein n=1 Tax=Streptomyces sp. NPDC088387 TaxID=3365859 RepID=UPI00380EBEDA